MGPGSEHTTLLEAGSRDLPVTSSPVPVPVQFSDCQINRFKMIFQQLDINGDGQVSPAELRKALKHMNIKVDEGVCKAMVLEYNKEGYLNMDTFMEIVTDLYSSGLLNNVKDYIELKSPESRKRNLEKIFDLFDRDQSGNISSNEIKTMAEVTGLQMSDEQINEFIKNADKDNNGEISKEEFLDYFNQ